MEVGTRIKVKLLTDELLDISGPQSSQISRLRDLTYVYSKSFTKENVLCTFTIPDNVVVSGKSFCFNKGEILYPRTLSDFVSYAYLKGFDLFWDLDTYNESIDPKLHSSSRRG
jgi:hypothetical protein